MFVHHCTPHSRILVHSHCTSYQGLSVCLAGPVGSLSLVSLPENRTMFKQETNLNLNPKITSYVSFLRVK